MYLIRYIEMFCRLNLTANFSCLLVLFFCICSVALISESIQKEKVLKDGVEISGHNVCILFSSIPPSPRVSYVYIGSSLSSTSYFHREKYVLSIIHSRLACILRASAYDLSSYVF